MKYPKVWKGDGAPDSARIIGEARVRGLQMVESPYLTAIGHDFSASKKNQFSEVMTFSAGADAYEPAFYSIGEIDGTDRLSGSVTGKNTFRNIGKVDAGEFSIPNLFYVGLNKGILPKLVDYSNGMWSIFSTENGKRFIEVLNFQSHPPGTNHGTRLWDVVAGSVNGGMSSAHTWGIAVRDDDGHAFGGYIYWLNGQWHIGATLRYEGFNCSIMVIERIGPETLIGFTAVYREAEIITDGSGNLIDANPGAAPSSFFSVSLNNGSTWEYINPSSSLAGLAMNVSVAQANQNLSRIVDTMRIQPVSTTRSIGVAEFIQSNGNDSFGFSILGEKEYRIFEFNKLGDSYTAANIGTLDSTEVSPDAGYFNSEYALINMHGVMLQWIPYDSNASHKIVAYTSVAGWTYTTLPWPAYKTGVSVWIDDSTLVCPVYDGKHSLYESFDFGATWRRRATIRSDALPPAAGYSVLQQFGIVRRFRDRIGRPVAPTPGAPWVTDKSVGNTP